MAAAAQNDCERNLSYARDRGRSHRHYRRQPLSNMREVTTNTVVPTSVPGTNEKPEANKKRSVDNDEEVVFQVKRQTKQEVIELTDDDENAGVPGGLYTLNQYTHVMTVLRIHLHRLSPVFIAPPAGVLGGNFPSDNSPTGRGGILRIDDRQMSNSQESSACRDVAPTGQSCSRNRSRCSKDSRREEDIAVCLVN